MTRFCPASPGVPAPFVPWGSIQATARAAAPSSPAADAPSPPKSKPKPGSRRAGVRQPWLGANQHVRFYPEQLRPYHGNPMRLLAPTPDGKRVTSDLVKAIRAGQVDTTELAFALNIPDGFQAINATRIQAIFRGQTVRAEFLLKKRATIKMQAAMRGLCWRNQLAELNWNARWIQTVWRSRTVGWRPWMARSPMRMIQLDKAATVVQAGQRSKTGREEFLVKKRAAIRIQKHVRGRQGRFMHLEWLSSRSGPAGLAKERERLMALMTAGSRLIDDLMQPEVAKALASYRSVYRQAADSEMSCGVPQLSKVGVNRELRGKIKRVKELYAEHAAELPPNVAELAACADWATDAAQPDGTFEWSPGTEGWLKEATTGNLMPQSTAT